MWIYLLSKVMRFLKIILEQNIILHTNFFQLKIWFWWKYFTQILGNCKMMMFGFSSLYLTCPITFSYQIVFVNFIPWVRSVECPANQLGTRGRPRKKLGSISTVTRKARLGQARESLFIHLFTHLFRPFFHSHIHFLVFTCKAFNEYLLPTGCMRHSI